MPELKCHVRLPGRAPAGLASCVRHTDHPPWPLLWEGQKATDGNPQGPGKVEDVCGSELDPRCQQARHRPAVVGARFPGRDPRRPDISSQHMGF